MLSTLFNKPSRLTLDISGAMGLVCGDDAVSALAAVHVYGNRRWLGWYNNPGSFQAFDQLGSFLKSSKSVHTDSTVLFGVKSCKGPKFRGAHSGAVVETGYVAELFMKECAAWDLEKKVVPGRKTQPVGITIVGLGQAPPSEIRLAHNSAFTLLFASIPIFVSLGTCVMSAICEDWFAASLILAGIVASGVAGFVLGSGKLWFSHPEPARGSPAGDGILGSDKDIVLLKGTKSAINSITHGHFSLRFASQSHYNLVRWCSFLFLIQAIAQLLLIPQASLFGQLMFLSSLGVSALYNSRLSSLDKEKIHRKLLFESVLQNPTLTKYTLGTRTTAVVFMLLVLQLQDPTALLNELLPNDTKIWKEWKATMMEKLRAPVDLHFQFADKIEDLSGFTRQENDLLWRLYDDVRAAYDAYRDYIRVPMLHTTSL